MVVDKTPLETRTTAPQDPPERCRRCGRPIEGRRRNGSCSDSCRMAERREREQRRKIELLNRIADAVEELRVELGLRRVPR